MVKHILGQAIFQSIVILVILFGGANFIREEFCGRWEDPSGKLYDLGECGGVKEVIEFG